MLTRSQGQCYMCCIFFDGRAGTCQFVENQCFWRVRFAFCFAIWVHSNGFTFTSAPRRTTHTQSNTTHTRYTYTDGHTIPMHAAHARADTNSSAPQARSYNLHSCYSHTPTLALLLHPNSTGAAAPCFPAALIAASRDLSIYGLTFTFMHVFCSMLCFCFCFDSVARSFLPRPRGARALLPRFSLRRRHTHTPATRDAIPKNPTPNPYYPNPETPRLAPLRRPARA